MKAISIFLFFLAASPALAAENPPEPCGGLPCTPRLHEIAAAFEAASGIEEGFAPFVASGECFHLADAYRPTDVHHGAVFLDVKDGKAYLGGSFGFFFPENPYQDWTVENSRERNPNLYQDKYRLELTPGFAFSDMNPGQTPIWWYWVKRSGAKTYVMGHWGVFHRFLCEMSVHQ